MGAIRLIYDETLRQFKTLGWAGQLNLEGTRKFMQGRWRIDHSAKTLAFLLWQLDADKQ
ncbi:MAG: hypothetical protein ACRD44_05810 [Bryobacteraceae bacterium]